MKDQKKDYTVTITETLIRRITITAESPDDAYERAHDLYYLERIVLDYSDLANASIDVEGEKA